VSLLTKILCVLVFAAVPQPTEVPLPCVDGNILSEIVEYMKKHATKQDIGGQDSQRVSAKELESFDKNLVKKDPDFLFELIMV
jgi:Skp1 family, tetramerisation domain